MMEKVMEVSREMKGVAEWEDEQEPKRETKLQLNNWNLFFSIFTLRYQCTPDLGNMSFGALALNNPLEWL